MNEEIKESLTYKQEIVKLKESVQKLVEERNEYIRRLQAIKEKLCTSFQYTDQQAIEGIGELQDYKKLNEGRIDDRVFMLTGENSKLWYLLRAVMKDETLKSIYVSDEEKYKVQETFNKSRF